MKNIERKKFAAEVVIPGLPEALSYEITASTPEVCVGDIVSVPLGNRLAQGWVVKQLPLREVSLPNKKKRPNKTKQQQLSILSKKVEPESASLKPVITASKAFLPEQLELFQWMAKYYGANLGAVIDNSIPKLSPGRKTTKYSITNSGLNFLKNSEDSDKLKRRAPRQFQVLSSLAETPNKTKSQNELSSISKSVSSSLKKLKELGLIKAESTFPEFSSTLPSKNIFSENIEVKLNKEQTIAIDRVCKKLNPKQFAPFLLFGVTGSGKTEVYLNCLEEALKNGGSALIVVPEISLTPQTLERFQNRLNQPVALLHSQISSSSRWISWSALLDGKVKIALGARSAVFAPIPNLSLIIVDEEHEQSYKQSDGLRYHARDVAVVRARQANCPIILGSATPSFESLLNANNKTYELLELPNRATSNPVPKIEVVDMTKLKKSDQLSEFISPPLHSAIEKAMESGEQVVLLYNRRGFSSYLQCESCGEVLRCSDCSISMTWHKSSARMNCHYCDLKLTPPEYCSQCRDSSLVAVDVDDSDSESFGKMSYRGGGTEKIFEEIESLFPKARVLRMDRDTVSQKDSYQTILEAMHKHEADILIGTQMIAKGHDLPGVTLVGIIDADIGLSMPDFRSSERTYQLITQAGGRAGRREKVGRVILQTRQANHPTIVAAATGRFKAFARYELEQRKALLYPPTRRLLRLVVSSPDPSTASSGSQILTDFVAELFEISAGKSEKNIDFSIMGPSPAPYEKLRGRYRWHTIIKCNSSSFLSGVANRINSERKNFCKSRDLRISIDIDPVEML